MGAAAQRAVERDAVIIPFPKPKTCWTCFHWRSLDTDIAGPVSFCALFTEVIDSEVWSAQDCLAYDYCDENTQPDDLPDDYQE